MNSPQVFGPYLALAIGLIAALLATGREFRMARGLDKALPLGRVCLAIPIIVFGAEHVTAPHTLARLVPAWMPGKLFWAWFVGIALIAAGLSFIFRIAIRLSATLLGVMFFSFVVLMDIPGAIRAPHNRFAWTLAAREAGFSAGAILLARNRLAPGAFYLIALVSIFYGVEHFLHPECVAAVPLAKLTPGWMPLGRFWTILTGAVLVIGGAAMFVRNLARRSAATLGVWVVILVLTFYLAIMLSQLDLEGINYFADTLMFGGVVLLASTWKGVARIAG